MLHHLLHVEQITALAAGTTQTCSAKCTAIKTDQSPEVPFLASELSASCSTRLVKYGSVHYTHTRIYARIYAVHGESGCCVRIFRQYTKSVHGSREPAGSFDLCS